MSNETHVGFLDTSSIDQIINRIKRACRKAKPGTVFVEYVILRTPDKQPPLLEMIRGFMPEGFDFERAAEPPKRRKKYRKGLYK